MTSRDLPRATCGPAAYLVLKALAFKSCGQDKDAYDLHYVLRNHGEGPSSVAAAFRPLQADRASQEALAILEADFTAPSSVGTMRVAEFLGRRGDDEFLADVAGFFRHFLRLCSRG